MPGFRLNRFSSSQMQEAQCICGMLSVSRASVGERKASSWLCTASESR